MTKKIKLLIDGDILVYRMGFASQSRNIEDIVDTPENAKHLVKKCINSMCQRFNTQNYKIYLTSADHSNFRFALAKTLPYKGNRDPKINPKAPAKPVYYDLLRNYLISSFPTEVVFGIEADDALGIHQCRLLLAADCEDDVPTPIMCSIDKDLDMIPGMHYNFVKDTIYESSDPGTLVLTEVGQTKITKKISGTGWMWFYAQMLLGDRSDNIPGLKGYGDMKVHKLLSSLIGKPEQQTWEAVQRAYFNSLLPTKMPYRQVVERLLEVADLLWIHRIHADCISSHLQTMGVLLEEQLL